MFGLKNHKRLFVEMVLFLVMFGLLFGSVVANVVLYNEVSILESDLKLVIQKHNEINHENNALKAEMADLKKVNKRLIEDCDADDVNRVIRKTKLPPLVGC